MDVAGLGSVQIDQNNEICLLLDSVESHDQLDTRDSNPTGTLEMLSDYIATVKNLPTDSAVHKTLEETEHNLNKLDCLRTALFYKVKQCEAFPSGSYTLKRRINRGEKVTMKYAKDCVLLCKFLDSGEFEDIQDMLNIVSENSVIDCSTPRARSREMSLSQTTVNTTQCDCNSAISQLKDITVQLRTDVAMMTAKCEAQDDELSQLRNSYNTLSQSFSTDLQTMQDKMRAHADRCPQADCLSGEITQISLDIEKLKEHKNTGVGLNRSMINAIKDDVIDLKRHKSDAVEQHCAMGDKLSTLDSLSKSVSSMNKTLTACNKDIIELKLGTDRLRDEKGMGISQIKAQAKSITHDISVLDDRLETVCQSNKSYNEGNSNLRARLCSLEKTVSTLSNSFDSVKNVTTSTAQCQAQTIEASITGALGIFAHGITDQFVELSSIIKHSLTDIANVMSSSLPGLPTPHAHGLDQASEDNSAQTLLDLTPNGTLLVTKDHANKLHHACVDSLVQTVADTTSNGTLLVNKPHVLESHHASADSHTQTVAGPLSNGTSTRSNLMTSYTSVLINGLPETATNAQYVPDRPTVSQPNTTREVTVPDHTAVDDTHFTVDEADCSSLIAVRISDRGQSNKKGDTNTITEDGFVGVARRQTFRYFLSGIGLSTKAQDIRKYLSDRDVSASVIRMMSSKRYNSQSARINIQKDDMSKIQGRDFWPAGVTCRKWQSNTMYNRNRDTHAGNSDDGQPENYRSDY